MPGSRPRADGAAPLRVAHRVPVWLQRTQTWLGVQVRSLPAARVESHVICERTANLDQFRVPNIHALSDVALPWRALDRLARDRGLRRHLAFAERAGRRHGIALVHSHFGPTGWSDVPLARRLGARHVCTFYGHDVNRLPATEPAWRGRYRELFASADRILCEGGHMADRIRALGCPPEKVQVHHLGVELDAIRFAPRAWRPGEPLRVLLCAAFREKKGLPDAIEALALLRDEVELEVTLVGGATPDPESREEAARIERALAGSGLGARVRRPGFLPHAGTLAAAHAHHVFLSPSVTARDGDTEGGAPVALIEMAATGMPVVSTRHCDIPEVVRDGETGLLAPERDPRALAALLRRLVAHPERWGAMGAAARRHIEAEYDARVQGERLAGIYEAVAAGG